MDSKRPYDDLLKNLFHEQAIELIPLLRPDYQITEVFDIEMPELRSHPLERSPSPLEEGLVGLAIPEAKIVEVYRTEWIERSGYFERAYRFTSSKTTKPSFLVIEVQTEHEADDQDLPRHLLAHFACINRYLGEMLNLEDEAEIGEQEKYKGTILNRGFDVYPFALCPFPGQVPAPIREEFMGEVMLAFNFKTLNLWEKDAREFLNGHASSIYYLLPVMKNTDATLLGLAIAELAQRFQGNERELARHLTGLYIMLQRSETMEEEEKRAAQKHLQPFTHLLDETLI